MAALIPLFLFLLCSSASARGAADIYLPCEKSKKKAPCAEKPAVTHNPVRSIVDRPKVDARKFRPQTIPSPQKGIRVVYLGTGGFYIERKYGTETVGIMTAPFFSHISLEALGFAALKSDADAVDTFLPQLVPPGDLRRVEAILAGHAHHDHILDLPRVLMHHCPKASAFGNTSMVNILAGAVPQARLASLNGSMYTDDQAAQNQNVTWTYSNNKRIRFTAIESDHSPNFKLGCVQVDFARGRVNTMRTDLPERARGWKVGQTLAFVIDFLKEGTTEVEFRIYYQDTPHAAGGADRARAFPNGSAKVDLAIVCTATSNYVEGYFTTLRQELNPEHYILGHWEHFFDEYSLDPSKLKPVNIKSLLTVTEPTEVIERLEKEDPGADWVLPTPGTELRY